MSQSQVKKKPKRIRSPYFGEIGDGDGNYGVEMGLIFGRVKGKEFNTGSDSIDSIDEVGTERLEELLD